MDSKKIRQALQLAQEYILMPEGHKPNRQVVIRELRAAIEETKKQEKDHE
ncbi:hypothetical protein [Endozoicomonas montiporae]|uniref:Uncharacterized protein n=1 Tax=Endozoicomonas montiporae CL-33 TaxID=570277 RepID=A0A142BA86_9GAMM|nr:hypothetical protein [Endozoicomonas montiporae]AMO55662.1 hypothetical protein EZMO1_1494 [Endozoicomonas montiporae CL-33]